MEILGNEILGIRETLRSIQVTDSIDVFTEYHSQVLLKLSEFEDKAREFCEFAS